MGKEYFVKTLYSLHCHSILNTLRILLDYKI